jgi:transposase
MQSQTAHTGRAPVPPLSQTLVVERLFAWLHWFRRLVIRWEYHAKNFLGMVQLGCIKILLGHI